MRFVRLRNGAHRVDSHRTKAGSDLQPRKYLEYMHFGAGEAFCQRRLTARFVLAALVATVWAGCALFRVPDEPPEPTPLQPVWMDEELEEHLDFLNTGEAARRTTGTQGYARAAAYVAARMREYRLQPALGDEFRTVYSTPINYPISSALRTAHGADSLVFYPGIDILADGRSDSGSVSVRIVVNTDDTTGIHQAPKVPFGVLFQEGSVDRTTLARWRAAGAVLAITVEPLTPRFYNARVPGLLAFQLTPGSLLRLISPEVAAAPYGRPIRQERRIVGRVRSDYEPRAGAMNVMGYIAGKHPVHGRDLVLVCADLDAVSDFAGIPTIDFGNFGVGTAALLEVARNLSFVSRRWSLPERSVMIAVWSGAQLGHQGLRYFLENPTWSLSRVTSVIYLGLTADEEPAVRKLLADRGLTLHVIPPSAEPLFERSLVLTPDPAIRRMQRERSRAARTAPAPDRDEVAPDMSVVVDSAVVQARRIADAAYGRIMFATTHPKPFHPVREDTLSIPSDFGDESP